jgi:Baseplate J-like protein
MTATFPICPCDDLTAPMPANLSHLPAIVYRAGDYVSFRQAVLTPLTMPGNPAPVPIEQALSVDGMPVWRTDGAGDLAVMIAEWFAYIGDIVAFYNERIANESYLRTAVLASSVNNLIGVLGYRPRPAIGATGTLAALVSPGPSFGAPITLPKGLQFQSKPTPGLPPQTFELAQDTQISAPDQFPASPQPELLGTVTGWVWKLTEYRVGPWSVFGYGAVTEGEYTVSLRGAVKNIDPGALLRLRSRDASIGGGPWLATVLKTAINPTASGGQQTLLTFTLSGAAPDKISAAQAALESVGQSANVWSAFGAGGWLIKRDVHLAGIARQIQPGDWVLFNAGPQGPTPLLAQVAATSETIWDANGSATSHTIAGGSTTVKSGSKTTTIDTTPIPILHTVITLSADLPSGWSSVTSASVGFQWTSAATLIDQPFSTWTGSPNQLVGIGGNDFPQASKLGVLLQDSNGVGITAQGTSAGDRSLSIGGLPDPVPPLQPPFLVLPNTLPVTRGKTVTKEIAGSGDATLPNQDFKLSQSPVTYLQQGASYASTISLTVNGLPWTEVPYFYEQSADATVFITREDNDGYTHLIFGDGVNGARLPTGMNNVVATYRVGAGAASPPAGKLTMIANPYPGLRAVLNPLAVGGGADADQPGQIRHDAPRSVLTFGRAVSVFDYAAIAAQVPGVTRANAVWAWDDATQRALVRVYVGDTPAAARSAKQALAAAGDPNRPVKVTQATELDVALVLTLVYVPGIDTDQLTGSVQAALTDTENGLFGAWNLNVGQTVFVSQIESAVLGVTGAVALTALRFVANGAVVAGPIFNPGDDGYFTLDPANINFSLEPDPNG